MKWKRFFYVDVIEMLRFAQHEFVRCNSSHYAGFPLPSVTA